MPYLLTCSYNLLFVKAVDKSVIKKKQTRIQVPIPIMEKALLLGDVNAIMKEEKKHPVIIIYSLALIFNLSLMLWL